ncbi:MAG: hypothetical protein ABI861_01775 [Panacibacter sp.]
MIDTNLLILLISAMVIIGGVSAYITYLKISKKPTEAVRDKGASATMQLQAYERLLLLTDRIALPNLISRMNQPGISAKEMQYILINSIKEEFNYNISQQIYVSADAWTALKTLKDQNMLIINQFGNTLPPEAGSADLNKSLLEYAMSDPKGAVHDMVSEVLSYEAKKLMG